MVRDPATLKPLEAAGEWKPAEDFYWARRIRDGDVIEVDTEGERESAAELCPPAGEPFRGA